MIRIRRALVLVAAAVCLGALAACSSTPQFGSTWSAKSNAAAKAPASSVMRTTGAVAQSATPGSNGKADDLQRGKKYLRSNSFALAEQSFQSAVDRHPDNAAAWIGLGTSEDHLHQLDLADHAYDQAMRLVGPTAEVLNGQGYSLMLRGDYAQAQKKFEEAEAKDPANPYVQANMRLLTNGYFASKVSH
jgi:Flp pilus assembly protein TadD